MRKFHIGDVLSVITNKILPPNGIGGLYNILNYMTGTSVFTHQLPRACEVCKPYILQQHPQLKEVDASEVTPENCLEWCMEQAQKFGLYLEISPLPKGVFQRKDPYTELVEMAGKERVIKCVAPTSKS